MPSAYSSTSFSVSEQFAVAVVGQRSDLLCRGPVCSADRRTDVNSKGAANERGHAQLRQVLQGRLHQVAGEKRLFHLAVAPEKLGVMRGDLYWHHHASHLAFRQRIDDSREETAE